MKKVISCFVMLLFSFSLLAQEGTPVKAFWDDPINHPMLPLYAASALVIIVFILLIGVTLYLVQILNLFMAQAVKEKALKEGKAVVAKPTFWSELTQKLNASVPVAQEKDIDMGHDFDGIRELDNHLPPWWKWLFYGTIAWGVVYFIIYHVSVSLPLSIEEYNNEIALAKEQSDKLKASKPGMAIDENTLVYTADASFIEKGKAVFMGTNCGACHRPDGGGNTIGPNLTDEYWIHGGGVKNVFSTIKNGAVEKGMPAWGKAMSVEDVRNVAFFVMSLQGSAPANAKAPQGEIYKEEKTTTVAADSSRVRASL